MGRILVVDDDASIRDLLTAAFEIEGHEVATLPDGSEAVERTAAWQPHVLILDVMMPGRDGFEVLDDLKGDARTRDVPVVMLTALEGADGEERGIAGGAAYYVHKPFHLDLFVATVEMCMLDDGTDVPVENADITLIRDQLGDL